MKKLSLVCYCCGEPIIGHHVTLVTMQDPADRVFVMKVEHANRADAEFETVKREEERDIDIDDGA